MAAGAEKVNPVKEDMALTSGTVSDIAVGQWFNCALISAGSVKCWGSNANGELGSGTINDFSSTPLSVSGATNVTQISAAFSSACALISGGSVKCWGDGVDLGNGIIGYSPTPVSVPEITNVTQISAGGDHSCALISSGSIRCWGNNEWGELGDGTTSDGTISFTPVSVSGIANATQISAGGFGACALISGGSVKCWGLNANGQLGNGTTNYFSATPVRISGIANATQISAGDSSACALISGGSVKCWGLNANGQLGNGTTRNFSSTPLRVRRIANATQISAGYLHTCAIVSGGRVKCWGWNGYGQLGNGTTTNSSAPVLVSGIAHVIRIGAGYENTCALNSGGSVKCWGLNNYGQLGNATTKHKSKVPVDVSGL